MGVALITGASSGIGRETAMKLAADGYDLILAARRRNRLKELKDKILKLYPERKIVTLELDVRDAKQVELTLRGLTKDPNGCQELLESLNVVVNNAGLAKGVDPMPEADIDDWETMIETNILGLLYVTRWTLGSIKKNRGHVVNIGSVAGRWTYPGGGVYCATKFAVRALSEGLRLDLQGSGVRVTNIEPGKVLTEFSEVRLGDAELASKEYDGYEALSPVDIAECISWALARPAHVNIQELVVFPTAQASVTHLARSSHQKVTPK